MTVAAGDAHDICIYAGRYRVIFPILDADGDLVTGATGLDSEISKDQGTFADCTNEATEIATSSGMYYLDLTATETTAKSITVIVKTTSSGAKTTVLHIPVWRSVAYTALDGLISSATSTTVTLSSGSSEGWYVGCYMQCTNNTPTNIQGQTRKITAFTGTVFTVDSAWGTNPSSSSNISILLPPSVNVSGWNALTPSVLATDGGPVGVNVTQISGSNVSTSSAQLGVNVVNAGATAWGSGAITAGSIASNAITSAKIASGAITNATFASGAIDATAIAANAIGASELAADAVAEIADAVWDEDATGHQTTGTFGQAIGDPVADTDTIWGLVNTNLNATVSSRASQTSVDTIDDFLDTEVQAIKDKTDLIPGTQDGKTFAEHILLQSAALLGKASGLATTTAVYRSVDDTLDRITATVDADGNRSAVTYDTSSP